MRWAYLLCEDECGEQDGPPRGAEDGDARDGDEALDVDERDDEALGREARALVHRVQRAVDGLLGGHLALRARGAGRPRLSVHRSGKHIYAQVIDDAQGRTIASASTLEKDVRGTSGANVDAATLVGKRVAEAAKQAGVTRVVFDRGGFLFHGRVKALAEAAREAGLEF